MKRKNILSELSIPQPELEKMLSDSFYVRMNKHYTATVRRLKDFIDYIENEENELGEMFGEITRVAKVALETPKMGVNGMEYDTVEDSDFYSHLLKIIGYVKGMQTFNLNPHTFIELKDPSHTISIKTENGKTLTFAVIGNKCVDIQFQNSELPNNGIPQFNVIGFNEGGIPIKRTTVALVTVLLDSNEA